MIRLQTWIARSGLSSRRGAEALIVAGRVSVNGIVVTELGTKVDFSDQISVDGKLLKQESIKRYLVLNKPRGFMTTMADPEGRPLAVSLIKPYVSERVYNVGRLDQWSQGLILFTNDGDFAALVGHPSSGIEKEYEVRTEEAIPGEFLREFERGLLVDGQQYRALKARLIGPSLARIVLVEGKNREIRRVFASQSLRPLALNRVRIGPILIGSLQEGGYRELSIDEIAGLRKQAATWNSTSHAKGKV